jgi:hypothetical protein
MRELQPVPCDMPMQGPVMNVEEIDQMLAHLRNDLEEQRRYYRY